MWWRTQVSRHPFSMRPEMARWQYQGDTLRSTLAFVWCQECQSDECWCVVALLKSGWFYWVEAWYVMWRCASCDEGLKCHAIHFRWGLKWLVDNTKGTPWEAHWHSFGVRNAKVMNVDALLHFWNAGGSTGWKRGMWCEGVLHVMKDSSVTPSIFDEAWNGSLTVPSGHPKNHTTYLVISPSFCIHSLPRWFSDSSPDVFNNWGPGDLSKIQCFRVFGVCSPLLKQVQLQQLQTNAASLLGWPAEGAWNLAVPM